MKTIGYVRNIADLGNLEHDAVNQIQYNYLLLVFSKKNNIFAKKNCARFGIFNIETRRGRL